MLPATLPRAYGFWIGMLLLGPALFYMFMAGRQLLPTLGWWGRGGNNACVQLMQGL